MIEKTCTKCSKKIYYRNSTGLCNSCAHKGQKGPNYKHGIYSKNNVCLDCSTKVTKLGIRCKKCAQIYLYKINPFRRNGFHNPMYGKKYPNDLNGINNPNYIDGRTGINYPKEFYNKRELIKIRDNYNCQNCGMTEEEHIIVLGTSLEVHHIDYNKLNNDDSNLITTCKQCNVRANSNREQWTDFYQKKIQMIYA